MTLNEAIKQLHELRCNEDVPVYLKPAIAEVINTLLMDAQEVRYGWWVDVEGYEGLLYRCSACEDERYKHTTVKYPYCPYCGALMMDEVSE